MTAAARGSVRPLGPGSPDRLWRLTTVVWAGALTGYALLDKGFAYLHVPGTPIYVGEVLMALIVVLVAIDTRHVAGNRSDVVTVLALYCGWAALRTIPGVVTDGIDAVRDAALWYYAGVAVLAMAWFARHGAEVALARASRFLGRLAVPFLLWAPFAVFFERLGGGTFGPTVPDSEIRLYTHKPSNLAAIATLVALHAWLGPRDGIPAARRPVVFGGALLAIAMAGTQTRGGLLAAVAGLGVAGFAARRPAGAVGPGRTRPSVAGRGIALCLVLFAVAHLADVSVPGDRDLSVRQLTGNVASMVGATPQESSVSTQRGTLDGNREWRERLWTTVLRKTFEQDKDVAGWGFGPNLGDELGFENLLGDGSLRSPHNSHLSVIARTGIIGFTLWLVLWALWGRALYALARRPGPFASAAAVLLGAVLTMHVNAYFDPAFESPQAATWLWTLFGVGAALGIADRRRRPARPVAARTRWSPDGGR